MGKTGYTDPQFFRRLFPGIPALCAFGRRKPYIAGGALGLAVSILFLFQPPELAGEEMTLYFGFWLFALFFFWALITIPYESLGPEMTTDYHERTVPSAVCSFWVRQMPVCTGCWCFCPVSVSAPGWHCRPTSWPM